MGSALTVITGIEKKNVSINIFYERFKFKYVFNLNIS